MTTKRTTAIAACALALAVTLTTRPANADPDPTPQAQRPGAPPTVQPTPPPQPSDLPPPPQQAQAAPQGSTGQWVFTDQYGWLWMPYGDGYVYAPNGGDPYEYVYYPVSGWTWLMAPWIWGWGPQPYFGVFGPSRFGWNHAFGVRGGPAFHAAPRLRGGFTAGHGGFAGHGGGFHGGGFHGGGGHHR
jgi:uncharacterized membrane protein YgcG